MFGRKRKHQKDGEEKTDQSSSPESPNDLAETQKEDREKEVQSDENMYKTSKTIEVEGKTTQDISPVVCSTTIVVNTGHKSGSQIKSEASTKDSKSPSDVPSSPSITRLTPPPQGPTFKAKASNAVWTPGQTKRTIDTTKSEGTMNVQNEDGETSPIWQPFNGVLEQKLQFKSIKMEKSISGKDESIQKENQEVNLVGNSVKKMTRKLETQSNFTTETTTHISPTSPISRLSSNKLPQSQSPTVILLQKAREGQIPKGALYIDDKTKDMNFERTITDQKIKDNSNSIFQDITTTTIIKAPPKYEGIGPTIHGIPVSLRTAVKEEYGSDWYKTMYRSLHKFDKPNADSLTVKYGKKGNMPHAGGYMSEPEIDKEDEYPTKFATIDYRHRPERLQQNKKTSPEILDSSDRAIPSHLRSYQEIYKNQPRSISEYEPGHSSISEREERLFWADFWETIDEMQKERYLPSLDQPKPSYVYRDGYESDSTLFRRTGKPSSLDPQQQKTWYRKIQQGSDIPFSGLGKPAPERLKISPHKYQETEVNIHYRSPIRSLEKEYIEEEELRKRQEEAMRRFYEEERYKKQLQQLAEIEMRRHNDYFTPSQKSPISLNRYDNPFELSTTPPPRTPEPRTMARARFNFTAQTSRELSLNKGDIVYIIRKIDKNWYEGEHHGMIGIFPIKYIEIIPFKSGTLKSKQATEGLANVKYNFRAQTPLELSIFKGEKVVLTKQIDNNWYEGRIGNKKGIFPASYVDVIKEPTEIDTICVSPKPVSPDYVPNVNEMEKNHQSHFLNSNLYTQDLSNGPIVQEKKQPLTQSLHIDTTNDLIPYQALYNYHPQNEDELELQEKDIIYVMEKCDDGWYVGTSLRTGLFGTFPGNYVERI